MKLLAASPVIATQISAELNVTVPSSIRRSAGQRLKTQSTPRRIGARLDMDLARGKRPRIVKASPRATHFLQKWRPAQKTSQDSQIRLPQLRQAAVHSRSECVAQCIRYSCSSDCRYE